MAFRLLRAADVLLEGMGRIWSPARRRKQRTRLR